METNGKINGAGVSNTPTPDAAALLHATTHNGNGSRPAIVADVYRAICQVAKEISRDGISKGRRNEQQGYGFRGIDDVMNALSAPLAGADLVILPRMVSRTQEERPTAKGGILFYVTVQAHFDFVSARDGSCHTVIMYGEAMDSADKATNKAMSAAFKYACLQVFCIPTEGMADCDATTPQPEPQAKPAPKPAAPISAPGTQAAAAAVAQEKIRTGNFATSRPWSNRGEMKRAFGVLREKVGEVVYLSELARFQVTPELNWKSTDQATECWHYLSHLASREVA